MASEELIDVADLRVGMFIHLDIGWMRHPFPVSDFRVASTEQIAVLKGLGIKRVRWSPALSQSQADAPPPAEAPAAPSGRAAATPGTPSAEPPDPQARIAAARREALKAQQQALSQCQTQYDEAARAIQEIQANALAKPKQALEVSQALCRSLLDKMLVQDEVSLRLITEVAGDRAGAHALNVSIISLLLARAAGLPEADLMELGVGALLHDIGKLEVEPRLRHQSDQFTPAEMAGYQWHVAKGVEIGQRMGLSQPALAVLAQHHEMADGRGFPQRLVGERMHQAARVVALVNRFDGLCNPQLLNRKSLTPHEALSLLFAQGRSRFDAALLNAFIRMMGVYPPGSTVQLTDDRYAIVVGVNASRPLKPQVLVHEPKVPAREALVLHLEQHPHLGVRRSLKPIDLPDEAVAYLRPRQRVAYFPLADQALAPFSSAA